MVRSFHQYSSRAQVMVCALLSIGAFGATWRTVIEPERIELAARRTHLAVVQTGVHRVSEIAKRLPAVQNDIATLEATLLQTTAVMPVETDAQSVLHGLHSLASESGLLISGFTPKAGAERDQYFAWPIELTLEGAYHDLVRFFDRVASDPRLTSVSNLQFTARTTANGPRHESVHATSVATTFVFPPSGSPIDFRPEGVGVPPKSEYDDGGRRDPFIGLLAERVSTPAGESAEARASGLAGVAVMEVAVRGIISIGQNWLALVAGPDGATYLVHENDRLHDGVVRRIDREAVVFLARMPNGPGRIVTREVRRSLRPSPGEGR